MTGASKILTVSYGTFSCTLEGFDDPFNTMKAIAEYFRDLAAEDRYFGAEPPTPDAAMLHRIAEREIHRRVEAKIQDNGVILRAGEPEEAPVAAPRPALAPAAAVSGTSVAEKLQRIRAKHAPAPIAAPVAAPVAVPAPEAEDYSEDEHAEDLSTAQAEVAVTDDQIDIPDQLEKILTEAETMADPVDEVPVPEEPALAAAELLAAVEDDQDEEVIEYNDQFSEEFADQPESEDFAAPAAMAESVEPAATEDDDLALLSGLSEVLAADPLPEDLSADETADLPEEFEDAAEDAEDGLLSALDAEDFAAAEPKADVAPVRIEQPASDDDVLARLGALIDPEGDSAEDETPAIEAVAEPAAAPEPAPEPAPVAEAAPRARARVIRIRRADALAPAAAAAPVAAPAAASALSDEAEAALQAELAALEAELGANIDLAEPEVAPEPEAMPEPAAAPVAEAPHSPAPKAEDDAVRRLMEQADTAMEDDESRRRHSAIAHLKAAVAATTADRDFKEKSEKAQATKLDTYRDDLERVVRPRRPVAETTARADQAAGESAARPSPLVLVSEQRIDRPRPVAPAPATPAPVAAEAPRSVMPVRPRRVTAESLDARPSLPLVAATARMIDEDDQDEADDTDNVFTEGASFGEFAEQLGASELPDLLEAAAVYCAEVLQRPEFSRPLVMRQLTTLADQAPANREDYLRGFGSLLRQGRIAKVKRGLFALTDRSPYLAEARKIAG